MKVFSSTETGKRKNNQDSFLAIDTLPVLAVADGMGGYAGGDVASSLAIKEIKNYWQRGVQNGKVMDDVVASMELANYAVFEKTLEMVELCRMGTTLTIAVVMGGYACVGHVGDSRCLHYSKRMEKWQTITKNQNLESDLIAAGVTGQAAGGWSNHLTQVVGRQENIVPLTYKFEIEPDDYLLLATDGFFGGGIERELNELTAQHNKINKLGQILAKRSMELDDSDNITLLLAQV